MCLDTLVDKLKMETLGPQPDAVCEQVAKRNVDYRALSGRGFPGRRALLLGRPVVTQVASCGAMGISRPAALRYAVVAFTDLAVYCHRW